MALKRLSESDYHVADESTDIRGWSVTDSLGEDVGRIDGLLFDPDQKRVVYAILDMGQRCVLLPIKDVALDETHRRVAAGQYDRTRLAALRPYREGAFDEQEEQAHYQGFFGSRGEGERLDYDRARGTDVPRRIQLLEEHLQIGKRPVKTGEVEIGKRPVTETVSEEIELATERINIERHPVNRPVTGNERIGTDSETIRVPLYAEEAVKEKRAFITEEVEINKVKDKTTQHVTEQVSHEELVVDDAKSHEFAAAEPTEAELAERERLASERKRDKQDKRFF